LRRFAALTRLVVFRLTALRCAFFFVATLEAERCDAGCGEGAPVVACCPPHSAVG